MKDASRLSMGMAQVPQLAYITSAVYIPKQIRHAIYTLFKLGTASLRLLILLQNLRSLLWLHLPMDCDSRWNREKWDCFVYIIH